MNSSEADPIFNGQTITYQYTFVDKRTGEPIVISAPTTYELKRRGAAYSSGSATILDSLLGQVTADVVFSLSDIDEEGEEVNIQFFDGNGVPGVPQVEFVSPNVHDIAAASQKIL